jgi:hypothetical protein
MLGPQAEIEKVNAISRHMPRYVCDFFMGFLELKGVKV